MKLILSTLILASLSATGTAGTLRNLKGKTFSDYSGTDYAFCAYIGDTESDAVDAEDPWATGDMSDLYAYYTDGDDTTPTDDFRTAALESACGGARSPGCQTITDQTACGQAGCNWNVNQLQCNGGGNNGYTATWEGEDIKCTDTRISTVSHGDTIPAEYGNAICRDANGCIVDYVDNGTPASESFNDGDEITRDGTCGNYEDVYDTDGNVVGTNDLSCDVEDVYEGYYMCFNPNSPHTFPRTICQPNDEDPAHMIDKSTFASCGWCCQGYLDKWTDASCDAGTACDSDGDLANDGFLLNVANGKNQKKDGNVPPTEEKCVTSSDIADTLNQFWGSSCF